MLKYWKDVNGTKFSSVGRGDWYYKAINGTRVQGYMLIGNITVTREQTTAL